jgi:hypothetical protein
MDLPGLLGFAVYVWTIRAQIVQIDIAISATNQQTSESQCPVNVGDAESICRDSGMGGRRICAGMLFDSDHH